MAHRITAPSVLTVAEAELRIVMDDFVKVYERLDQDDDVNVKPNYSYTELIYLSILRSPNFCLPISEIYKYIKSRFSFFRNSTRKHWCNAVRHSLSKTKCFTKIAVGRGSSGNNNLNRSTYLWCIVPGSIVNFARGDYRPNVDTESGTNTLRWGYFRVNAGKFWDQVAVYLEKKMEVFQQMIFTTSSPGKVLEAQACYITGDTSLAQKSSANSPLLREHLYNVKQRQPTHTVHYGAHDNLSDSGTKDMSITQSPNIRDNTSRDSGNDSISDTSPEDRKRKHLENITNIGCRINASYISVNSSVLDDTRKTPDLPDLGHVSPLSISPSLSLIGNVTYEGESLTGSSFTSIYSTMPSYASTPVIASLTQQRFPPALSHYSHSVSPPLFPSLSPLSYPISSSNNSTPGNIIHSASPSGTFYPPYVPPSSSVPMSLPYLTSTVNSSKTVPSNVYMSRGSQSPFYKSLQTGSFDFGTFTSGFMPQLPPYQYDPYQTSMVSTENVYNSTPLYYHTGPDIAQTPTVDWSTM